MKDMEQTIRRNVVLAAIQRAIFCSESGRVLDIDDAYLVTLKDGKLSIICGKEWRRILSILPPSMLSDTFTEVWEGKTGNEVFPVPVPTIGSVAYFAAAIQEQTLARHKQEGIDCEPNTQNASTTIKDGLKYAKVDQGGSGRVCNRDHFRDQGIRESEPKKGIRHA